MAAELPYGLVSSGSGRHRQALQMALAPLLLPRFGEATIWTDSELAARSRGLSTPRREASNRLNHLATVHSESSAAAMRQKLRPSRALRLARVLLSTQYAYMLGRP